MEIPEEVVRGEEKGEEDEGGGKEGEDLGEGKYCLQHLRLCNMFFGFRIVCTEV